MEKIAEYKKVISEQTFFAYACKMMETLQPKDDESDVYAQRRHTLNRLGADPMIIHNAMQSLTPPPLPPMVANYNMNTMGSYNMGQGQGSLMNSSMQHHGYS